MRSGWRIAAPGMLLVLATGCNRWPENWPHKAHPVPPAAIAPSRPPSQMAELIPPMPQVPAVSDERPIRLDASIPPPEPVPTAPETAPRPTKRHTRSAGETAQESKETAPTEQPAQPNPDETASGQPSENSRIGQLSPATSGANTADRTALNDEINATEKSLKEIHRSLDSEERKTAELIRTFIGKARQALKMDDLDGAQNYSTKAKLLLQELTKP